MNDRSRQDLPGSGTSKLEQLVESHRTQLEQLKQQGRLGEELLARAAALLSQCEAGLNEFDPRTDVDLATQLATARAHIARGWIELAAVVGAD